MQVGKRMLFRGKGREGEGCVVKGVFLPVSADDSANMFEYERQQKIPGV